MNKKPILMTRLAAFLASPALAGAPKNATIEPVYCIKYEREAGSRIAAQECLTKRQWAEKGIDVDRLLKK